MSRRTTFLSALYRVQRSVAGYVTVEALDNGDMLQFEPGIDSDEIRQAIHRLPPDQVDWYLGGLFH